MSTGLSSTAKLPLELAFTSSVPGLDSGNLLFRQAIDIVPEDTVTSLYESLNAIQERELGGAVLRAIAGDQGIPQSSEQASYGCARVPDDREIDWRQPTDVIDCLIRGLTPPFPGAFTHLDASRPADDSSCVAASKYPPAKPRAFRNWVAQSSHGNASPILLTA